MGATAIGASCRGGSSRTVAMLCADTCTVCAGALVGSCSVRSGDGARLCAASPPICATSILGASADRSCTAPMLRTETAAIGATSLVANYPRCDALRRDFANLRNVLRHDQCWSIIHGADALRWTPLSPRNQCWWFAHSGDALRCDLRYLRDQRGGEQRWQLVVNGGDALRRDLRYRCDCLPVRPALALRAQWRCSGLKLRLSFRPPPVRPTLAPRARWRCSLKQYSPSGARGGGARLSVS